MNGNKFDTYKKNDILTAGPKALIAMCYSASIRNLKVAKTNVIEKDYEEKGNAIDKASAIINELLAALNFEKGGVIAKNLDLLYRYMLGRLIIANSNKDTEVIDQVIWMLEELGDAWNSISISKNIDKPHINQPISSPTHTVSQRSGFVA